LAGFSGDDLAGRLAKRVHGAGLFAVQRLPVALAAWLPRNIPADGMARRAFSGLED
tara:strand:- start:1191 stop:1358 length:168 start_codon:yes stop_codon:yes gene_type:complete